ncbi:MAG: hypothetical protein C5S49_00485 [Candidatus Methanogaster sp.]|nr:MAG: hypothetical protein C5S49_00485 [ANME-2 cluster archaeon]
MGSSVVILFPMCHLKNAAIDKKNTNEHRITDMPHKCTNCEQIFKDGSVDILNGCPNCGWNKFLYVPAKPATETETGAEDPDEETQLDAVEGKKDAVPDMEGEDKGQEGKGSTGRAQ